MPLPSPMDEEFYTLARAHIMAHLRAHLEPMPEGRILEIGPELRWPQFETLDIKPGSTYQADITKRTPIADSAFDLILCLDVLEHTCQPFDAMTELRRILKPGGLLLLSAPWNFRYHNPLPDNWRFSEHGWKVLLKDWDEVNIEPLETPGRVLMPIHLNVSARCNKEKDTAASDLKFRFIE